MSSIYRFLLCCLIFFILSGCTTIKKQHALDQKHAEKVLLNAIKSNQIDKHRKLHLSADVYEALYPKEIINNKEIDRKYVFDVSVKQMPIHDFFQALMVNLNKSVVVSPRLKQKISMSLKDATIQDVFTALRDMYGLSIKKTPYGYKVSSQKLITRIFTLNYLNLDRESKNSISMSSTNLSGDSSSSDSSGTNQITSKISTGAFWSNTVSTIQSIVGAEVTGIQKGGKRSRRSSRRRGKASNASQASVQVNTETGVIIVTALPSKMAKVAKYIQYTQAIMNRQVVIEAKLIEIQLNKGFETGVNWTSLGFSMAGGTGTYTFTDSTHFTRSIAATIQLLQSEGKVTVLSSPRVVTLNNQQALLEVGTTQYYVTKVTSGTTPVGQTATVTSNVDMEPFFSGISLSVLPQISHKGDITMYIHPSVTQVSSTNTEVTLSDSQKLSLPTAKSDVRETDSLVRIASGQVIVLGGLMQSRTKTEHKGLPWFGGSKLTMQRGDSSAVTELVILLKATIVNQKQWEKQLKEFNDHYKELATASE